MGFFSNVLNRLTKHQSDATAQVMDIAEKEASGKQVRLQPEEFNALLNSANLTKGAYRQMAETLAKYKALVEEAKLIPQLNAEIEKAEAVFLAHAEETNAILRARRDKGNELYSAFEALRSKREAACRAEREAQVIAYRDLKADVNLDEHTITCVSQGVLSLSDPKAPFYEVDAATFREQQKRRRHLHRVASFLRKREHYAEYELWSQRKPRFNPDMGLRASAGHEDALNKWRNEEPHYVEPTWAEVLKIGPAKLLEVFQHSKGAICEMFNLSVEELEA